MAQFEIIVGTVLGASEYVADALKETFEANQDQATIYLEPNFDSINHDATWVVCTSTHGAGELPDNIQEFAAQLKGKDLNGLSFLVVGLGDSSYDTFCNAAMIMQQKLEECGAKLLAPAIHIDVLTHPIPEDKAVEWLQDYLEKHA